MAFEISAWRKPQGFLEAEAVMAAFEANAHDLARAGGK
jgi:hypothetical protein